MYEINYIRKSICQYAFVFNPSKAVFTTRITHILFVLICADLNGRAYRYVGDGITRYCLITIWWLHFIQQYENADDNVVEIVDLSHTNFEYLLCSLRSLIQIIYLPSWTSSNYIICYTSNETWGSTIYLYSINHTWIMISFNLDTFEIQYLVQIL